MAKSPEEMAASMIQNLPEKTGKSLDEWLEITQASGLEKHGQILEMLKTDHGMTHGFANLVAMKTLQSGAEPSQDDLLEAQYSGPKADLRPIYDTIVAAVAKFGGDVEISPKKTYVSLRRNKQFGIVQPSSRTRVDVGINIKGADSTDRLEASGSFNAMVSHRVRLTEKSQVDDELIAWLQQAYDAS